jgi:UDP-N-acetylmuramate--alanine ligase
VLEKGKVNGSKRKVHFVGVGGIGMSGLAEVLLNLGYDVSGSDLKGTDITERLADRGLRFNEGHRPDNIEDAGILVVSAAVAEDNVEVVAARAKGVPVIHRSDLLADLMRMKPNAVAVGGTHGKTTTTSMISAILDHANIGATSIVGGILHRSGTNARWGTGDYIVAEADEHDGSFLRLHPTVAVVTNIDAEHLEYYGTIDKIKRAFTEFCNSVPFYGYAIVCADDPNCRAICEDVESVCITYGLSEHASLTAANVSIKLPDTQQSKVDQFAALRTCFDVISHDDRLGEGRLGRVCIHAIGEHNVRNALAAIAVGLSLGLKWPQVVEGLTLYDGVRRRLQVHGAHGGITVIEDYAHHPTELATTIEAVRQTEPGRIVCVFQPHLYSRTKYFYDDFAAVLAKADRAIVTDIYPSREEPMPGVDSGLIVDAAWELGARHVELVNHMDEVPALLLEDLREGDIVLVMGAGNINRICEPLLTAIGQRLVHLR